MNRSTVLAFLLAMLLLLAACTTQPSPTPAPTAITQPTLTSAPTVTAPPASAPTATPEPTLATTSCPAGYARHIDAEIGFSACYPEGWQVSTEEDPDSEAIAVLFMAAVEEPDPSTSQILVQIVPLSTDKSEAEVLEQFAMELMNRRARTGQEVVPIQAIGIDGRPAAEDSQTGSMSAGGQTAQITAWIAGFPANQKMWYITVSGASEPAGEVEAMYREFLSQFHLLP